MVNDMATWETNRKLMTGLWPNHKPSAEERDLFAERLANRRQDWLEIALKSHRAEDADGAFKPKLSRIITQYQLIAEAGEDRGGGVKPSKPCVYRAAWQETRHGMTYVMSSPGTFPTEREALGYASQLGRHPQAIRVGDAPHGYDEDEVMADDRVMRGELASWPADRLAKAIAFAATLPLAIDPKTLPANPMDWKRFVVGCVWAADEYSRSRPTKAETPAGRPRPKTASR